MPQICHNGKGVDAASIRKRGCGLESQGTAARLPCDFRTVLDALQGRTIINHDGLHTSLRTNRLVDLRPCQWTTASDHAAPPW